ncbi:hypothetical protein BDV25DRAFT_137044 [Aspergillus avenaceus]|uniref:Heterokaryon incompatibility domain-containing protein n=1 Tax=Aspergillus avenaceus TaxID=36643 RepID=A0A5N6U4F2_ASPAV|nr:hypothetical protein BDV25DRAFT_137044 [Aspergillus avenaceus]
MEHIPVPRGDVSVDAIHIPLRCNQRYTYDDQGFLSYPNRVQIDPTQLQEDKHPHLKLCDASPFVQAWLWFGLLGEVLHVGSRTTTAPKFISSKEFLKMRDGQPFLSTISLYKAIHEKSKRGSSILYNEWHQQRVESCLDTATKFTHNALATPYFQGLLAKDQTVGDLPDIFLTLLAVQALCQAIGASKSILFPCWSKSTLRGPGRSSPLANYLLLKSGWSPQEILELPQDVCARYYLSFFRQKASLRPSVKEDLLTPLHTEDCCGCELQQSQVSERDHPLDATKIPLFTFKKTGHKSGKLDMAIYTFDALKSTPYIAISHPRQSGLGNGTENSLPACQISRIQSLANQLVASSSSSDVAFWIDTLSLPLDRVARRSALRTAKAIFKHATSVLVLDSSISLYPISSAEEGLVRISYSNWKKRLWTIQEGALSHSLQFCFANRNVSLVDLFNEYSSSPQGPMTYNTLANPSHLCGENWKVRAETIDKFSEDVSAWADIITHSDRHDSESATIKKQDKEQFYRTLRLGYLSSSALEYFANDDERKLFPHVYQCLYQVYDPVIMDSNISRVIDKSFEAIVARLKKVRDLLSLNYLELEQG